MASGNTSANPSETWSTSVLAVPISARLWHGRCVYSGGLLSDVSNVDGADIEAVRDLIRRRPFSSYSKTFTTLETDDAKAARAWLVKLA
jgi:hypothetical protein